ncbi:MAG: universal stress protein [Planctomycetales bacterium]|nr:universal stress protein [Planctomycetales bacterium]
MDWLENRTIVVPFDFSDQSVDAVKLAEQLVSDEQEIHVIHVVPDFDAVSYPGLLGSPMDNVLRKKEAHEKMVDALCEVATDAVCLEVRDGDPGKEIAGFAEQIGAGLIVIPSHGRSGIGRVLMGSVAERVTRFAHCPVLVLRPQRKRKSSDTEREVKSSAAAELRLDDLLEVYSTDDSTDAEIVRNALRSEGIKCEIDGENQGGFTGLTSMPIRLFVRAEDFDRALKHIQTYQPK